MTGQILAPSVAAGGGARAKRLERVDGWIRRCLALEGDKAAVCGTAWGDDWRLGGRIHVNDAVRLSFQDPIWGVVRC